MGSNEFTILRKTEIADRHRYRSAELLDIWGRYDGTLEDLEELIAEALQIVENTAKGVIVIGRKEDEEDTSFEEVEVSHR